MSKFIKRLRGMAEQICDSMLASDIRAVRNERLTYLTPQRFRRIDKAVRQIVRGGIPGDFIEFGVALGGSAIVIARRAQAAGRQFHGFDVFGMIPEPTSPKDDSKSKERYKVIASGRSEGMGGDLYYGYRSDLYETVCASLSRHGVPVDNQRVVLHKGLFEVTWGDYGFRPIAFVHIDADWYDPVRFCLNAVADRMSNGGVIILDDYNDYGGCRTAADEFLSERSDFALERGENVILRRHGLKQGRALSGGA
jgi:asparagine synthase (glutamine-hydrolysing)